MIPMPVSTAAGWQEAPHEVEFGGSKMIRFRLDGKLYYVSPSQAAGLSDDELAVRFARPAEDVATDLFRGA